MSIATFKWRDVIGGAGRLGNAIVDELEGMIAQITGTWSIEHNADGTHGDVTADSLVVNGPVIVNDGPFTASGVDAVFDDVRIINRLIFAPDDNDFTVMIKRIAGPAFETTGHVIPDLNDQYDIGSTTKAFKSIYTEGGAGRGIRVDNKRLGYRDVAVGGVADLFVEGAWHPDADGTRDLGFSALSKFRWKRGYFSDLVFASGINEPQYSAGMGKWTNIAYAAGNFTASAGTWTVDSGDQIDLAYTLVGKTMTMAFAIISTDVSNAGAVLRIAIPGGFTSKTGANTQNLTRVTDAGTTYAVGIVAAQGGNAFIELYSDIQANGFAATSGDNTNVVGEITFPIN